MLVTGISLLEDVMLCTANSGAKKWICTKCDGSGRHLAEGGAKNDGGKLILNPLERDFFSPHLNPVVV